MSRLKVEVDKFADVVKSINSLVGKEVLVGIPEDKAEREDQEEQGPMNNATLGYIHENGSPAANIPARPFLVPGIRDAQGRINDRLKKAATAALDGNQSNAVDEMSAAGLVAQNSVKGKINSGDFVPLADSTLRARARRGRKGAKAELESRKEGNAPGTADAKPLIDTGQLRNSISFVVKSAK